MTKKELSHTLAERAGVSKTQALLLLNALAAVTHETLARGEDMVLPEIGKLSVQATAEREGRHPQTGAPMLIAAGKRVRFKVFKTLKDAANS